MDEVASFREVAGYPVWRERADGVTAIFAGRGAEGSRAEVLARVAGAARPVAWARQVHSARVVAAQAGECGEGDGLVARQAGLALAIVTADCVPVLLAGPGGVAAAHAGWRGIAAGVVGATVAALLGRDGGGKDGEPGADAGSLTAWIGPAIGPCCYETGEDVAEQVAAASGLRPAAAPGRPHLDLPAAVRRQLAAAGVGRIRLLRACTRCDAGRLHSYRRDGRGGGRNHAFIWRD